MDFRLDLVRACQVNVLLVGAQIGDLLRRSPGPTACSASARATQMRRQSRRLCASLHSRRISGEP